MKPTRKIDPRSLEIKHEVTDSEFRHYGKILEGFDMHPFLRALEEGTPLPESVDYVPDNAVLSALLEAKKFGTAIYGGMPVQFGRCNGHNTKLNCLELISKGGNYYDDEHT